MKRSSLFAVSMLLAAAFAGSAFAQVQPPGKIGLVNIAAFGDEKAGIPKFRAAYVKVQTKFTPQLNEINALKTRGNTLATEIQNLQKTPSNPSVPVAGSNNLQAKIDEFNGLKVRITRMEEDMDRESQKDYLATVGPVLADILKAMTEFAKQKGYAMILDGAKLEQSEILLGFDDKYDVTKEFIAYYNARPAGTAAVATPK